uniref:RING-type E3 ubiquitin transferase n=1 Tax=Geospiza parvula TaxID=87175 RepID=A0A8C3NHM7_GEOPR
MRILWVRPVPGSVTSTASLPRAGPALARQPAREGRRPAGEFPLPPAARPGREEEGEGAGAGAGKAPARPPPSLVRQGRSGAGGGASGRRGPESPCHGAREAVAAGSAPRRASEEAGGGGEGGGGRPAPRRLLCFHPLPGPAPAPLLSHRGGGGGRGRSGARAARGSPETGLGRRLWTRMSRHEDLYYGGEAFSVEQPQSFTCPYCGKMGYTETSLQEHVTSEHAETSTEVICPICAALPGGDPNHVTDDFAAHLTLEHRAPRDLDESSGVRHVRRMFHPGRGLGGPRARRSNMHFTTSSPGGLSSSQSSYSPSNREAMDPIAELLSQLSGVRRSAGGQLNSSGPSASQLQQLQMQLQLERQHAQAARQQLETARNATRRTNTINVSTTMTQSTTTTNTSNTENSQQTIQNSQFLLTRLNDPKMSEAERQSMESERADCSLFVQELLLSTLMQEESSSSDEDERGEIADFGAMGCVDIMPLDVALENLNLKESNKGNEPPPPPL